MSNKAYAELLGLAGQQHGAFSRNDAASLGVSRSTLQSAVRGGRLARPCPGVYTVVGSPDTQRQRMVVAVLSMPALAAVSHDTAAELWRLTSRGIGAIHVVTSRWDRVERPGVVVHESLDLIDEDVVLTEGIPVTSPQRTVVDLGATSRWLVERALEEGIRRDLHTLADVEAIVARVGRRGRRGVGVIRPLLEKRRRWDSSTESALEDLFRSTIAEMGLPIPQQQFTLRDDADTFVCRADFAYPRHRVLIELDSERHHTDRLSFRRDRNKQNQAATLGWTVLRFTWWDLTEDPYRVATQVRSVLGQSASVPRPAFLRR